MENNGKGTSIFYGVIGVATLVITIIGATFAYFSATTNSNVDAITAGGATLSLGFSQDDKGKKTDLIPIDVTLPEFNTGGFVGDTTDKCKDINGNNICSVYQFTISNPAGNAASQRVYGTIVPATNTFENFQFAIFKGTVGQVNASEETHEITKTVVADDKKPLDHDTEIRLTEAKVKKADAAVGQTVTWTEKIGWDVDGEAVDDFTTDFTYTTFTKNEDDASRKHVIGNKGDLIHSATTIPKGSTTPISIPGFEQVLDVGDAITYTIVMWIPETGSAQNADQGMSFAGGVNFTTEGNGTGVTGVLSTTSR